MGTGTIFAIPGVLGTSWNAEINTARTPTSPKQLISSFSATPANVRSIVTAMVNADLMAHASAKTFSPEQNAISVPQQPPVLLRRACTVQLLLINAVGMVASTLAPGLASAMLDLLAPTVKYAHRALTGLSASVAAHAITALATTD